MSSLLQRDFEFYLSHQDKLVEKYDGKYIIIQNGIILGKYDEALMAVTESQKSQKQGTFLVQKVSKGNGDYSQTFHSRVMFS